MWKLIIMSWFAGSYGGRGYYIYSVEFNSENSAKNAKSEILKVWDGNHKPIILVVPA